MKKFLIFILSICLVGSTVGCGSISGGEKKEEVEINIGKVPYPHEWVPANIIKVVAEEKGYKVNLVEGDIGFMFLGLSQGDIDIFPDVWLPVLHSTYMEKYEGKIDLVGTLTEEIPIGIAVPSYVDFNSISDLKENAESFGKKIVGVEPSAGMMLTANETLKEYELEDDIELISGSTPAMLAELDKAIKAQEPLVFLAWRPHTMFTKYDIKLLEDPKGIWSLDDDKIGVHPDLKDKAPDIYSFLQEFKLTTDEMEEILYQMENENKSIEELAKKWVDENREEVEQMFKK